MYGESDILIAESSLVYVASFSDKSCQSDYSTRSSDHHKHTSTTSVEVPTLDTSTEVCSIWMSAICCCLTSYCSVASKLVVWHVDTLNGKVNKSCCLQNNSITNVTFQEDVIGAALEDNSIILWDLDGLKQTAKFQHSPLYCTGPKQISCFCFTSTICVVALQSTVVIWNLQTTSIHNALDLSQIISKPVSQLQCIKDSDDILFCESGNLWVMEDIVLGKSRAALLYKVSCITQSFCLPHTSA